MNDRARTFLSGLRAALAAVFVGLLAGCASTDDSANLSERPWNAPKSWEHGMPAGMFEGR
jgi:hypothetical protein